MRSCAPSREAAAAGRPARRGRRARGRSRRGRARRAAPAWSTTHVSSARLPSSPSTRRSIRPCCGQSASDGGGDLPEAAGGVGRGRISWRCVSPLTSAITRGSLSSSASAALAAAGAVEAVVVGDDDRAVVGARRARRGGSRRPRSRDRAARAAGAVDGVEDDHAQVVADVERRSPGARRARAARGRADPRARRGRPPRGAGPAGRALARPGTPWPSSASMAARGTSRRSGESSRSRGRVSTRSRRLSSKVRSASSPVAIASVAADGRELALDVQVVVAERGVPGRAEAGGEEALLRAGEDPAVARRVEGGR